LLKRILFTENIGIKEYLSKIGNQGIQFKVRANNLFKKGKYKDAINEYIRALDIFNSIDKKYYELLNLSNITFIKLECLNNIAMCQLVLREYDKVLDITKEVLFLRLGIMF
jgi:hypothetical protein